jgi:hypothetical protein
MDVTKGVRRPPLEPFHGLRKTIHCVCILCLDLTVTIIVCSSAAFDALRAELAVWKADYSSLNEEV